MQTAKIYCDIRMPHSAPNFLQDCQILYFIPSFVFIAMSCKQLHGWQKSVTDFSSLFPVRLLRRFFFSPQDLFKRQSNKHLILLLLIKCVKKAEKFNVTFYVFNFLSGSELDTGEHIAVYM